MRKIPLKRLLIWSMIAFIAAVLATILGSFAYIGVISHKIDARIEQLHSTKSSNFYALNPAIKVGQQFAESELKLFLEDQGYTVKPNADDLLVREYAWRQDGDSRQLILFRPSFEGAGHPIDQLHAQVTLENRDGRLVVTDILNLEDKSKLENLESIPKQIGSYLAGRMRTQNSVLLSDMPVYMRYAVMAIEDAHFLEHYGVSLRGTLRALLKNLTAGRASQGGSTITQQLMKNLFFSNKKVLTRKFKEAIFAFVTERRHSKEAILEAYLNEVYLGQRSTHEIHGVSEGARYYFNRPVTDLSLAQSATLAAIVQAPNALDPRRFPEKSIQRRNRVLKKMLEFDFILQPEYEMAAAEPLGIVPPELSLENVDYFNDLVMDKLPANIQKRLDSEYLTIYVTLNPFLQSVGSRALRENIDRLTKTSKDIAAKAKKGIPLEGAMVAVSVKDCTILSLQGGKSYRASQFNRITQGKRQPGSLFKPFVFLTGFANTTGTPITPVTELEDTPFEWNYENQSWKPKNYDGKFRTSVTVREALEESINIPTARLAQRVGVPAIYETLRKAGITSPLPQVPSLSLGGAEVSPFELAEAYTTVANLGKSCPLRPFVEVYDENKNLLLENKISQQDALPPIPTFQTISLMKGVFTHGTARSAAWSGLKLQNFAGKTGTTNEAKDAWFVGFSPDILILVWIGYDTEEKVGLTGSSAALPAWIDFMKNAGSFSTERDFAIPEGLNACEVDRRPRNEDGVPAVKANDKQVEYFVKGTEPASGCRTPSAVLMPH